MSSETGRFAQKVCIVTGAGSGIGRATAERFAAEGARVVVVDVNPDHGNDVFGSIRSKKVGEAIFAQADVSNSAEVRAAINAAVSRWDQIDVLINNAAARQLRRARRRRHPDALAEPECEEWQGKAERICRQARRSCGGDLLSGIVRRASSTARRSLLTADDATSCNTFFGADP
jgi:NAD(P)-dependent dehydrogenase (short-subunit alcohol dehydrogenase family)